jgi:hypothetical protein
MAYGTTCVHGFRDVKKCSPCIAENVRQWRLRNPGRREKYKPEDGKRYLRWVANNKNRHGVIQKNSRLKKQFGISLEDYERMAKEQEGLCAICGKKQQEGIRRLAVDHNHKTKKVRGLLCWGCNGALGKFGDSIEMLKKAIEYLEAHDGPTS